MVSQACCTLRAASSSQASISTTGTGGSACGNTGARRLLVTDARRRLRFATDRSKSDLVVTSKTPNFHFVRFAHIVDSCFSTRHPVESSCARARVLLPGEHGQQDALAKDWTLERMQRAANLGGLRNSLNLTWSVFLGLAMPGARVCQISALDPTYVERSTGRSLEGLSAKHVLDVPGKFATGQVFQSTFACHRSRDQRSETIRNWIRKDTPGKQLT